jgi:hypothetical protein
MIIAYLDQNAASYLALAKHDSPWAAIRSALCAAFQTQRIVCPMPLETLIESAPCETLVRIAIEEFFHSVSGGTIFRSYPDIFIDKTLALIRPHHEAVAFGIVGYGWGKRDDAARITKESHAERRDRMKQRIQAHTSPSDAAGMSAMKIFRSGSLDRCAAFLRDLEKFIDVPTTSASEYEISWLINGLVCRGLSVTEAHEIHEAVRCHKWEGIFVNFFDLILGSRWEHDRLHRQRPNYEPNDEFDRWRAAVALGHSDVFITDAYMADLCHRANVSDYTPTTVFSTKQTDRIFHFIRQRA